MIAMSGKRYDLIVILFGVSELTFNLALKDDSVDNACINSSFSNAN